MYVCMYVCMYVYRISQCTPINSQMALELNELKMNICVTKQPLNYYSNLTHCTIVEAHLWGQMHVSKWGLGITIVKSYSVQVTRYPSFLNLCTVVPFPSNGPCRLPINPFGITALFKWI